MKQKQSDVLSIADGIAALRRVLRDRRRIWALVAMGLGLIFALVVLPLFLFQDGGVTADGRLLGWLAAGAGTGFIVLLMVFNEAQRPGE